MNRQVVIDTNCLVQMISVHSPYRPAWQAFREGQYTLCVSNDILNEYNEILGRVANTPQGVTLQALQFFEQSFFDCVDIYRLI